VTLEKQKNTRSCTPEKAYIGELLHGCGDVKTAVVLHGFNLGWQAGWGSPTPGVEYQQNGRRTDHRTTNCAYGRGSQVTTRADAGPSHSDKGGGNGGGERAGDTLSTGCAWRVDWQATTCDHPHVECVRAIDKARKHVCGGTGVV